IGTGESHPVKEFVEQALDYVGIEIEWNGEGINETGIIKSIDRKWSEVLKTGQIIIRIDTKYFRPTEVEFLMADISKAKKELGWEPKIKFNDLIKIMVDYDLLQNGITPKGNGIIISQNNGFAWTNHEYSFYEQIRERK
ncbi:MAG: GDP-mannose 4,6-dehydratase, partial [Candidatus Omnitrophica bacterium]|nr:GDP-mannose 4,6-dehydratase [Candidatus Omnitrophota bacterium]